MTLQQINWTNGGTMKNWDVFHNGKRVGTALKNRRGPYKLFIGDTCTEFATMEQFQAYLSVE